MMFIKALIFIFGLLFSSLISAKQENCSSATTLLVVAEADLAKAKALLADVSKNQNQAYEQIKVRTANVKKHMDKYLSSRDLIGAELYVKHMTIGFNNDYYIKLSEFLVKAHKDVLNTEKKVSKYRELKKKLCQKE